MVSYTQVNKKWWNTITPFHSRSKLYNLREFKKGKTSLQPLEIKEVGSVKGKSLLHLMCHFGMDTLSWAKRGATVTGVDLSDTSIALAKKISIETGIPATFICSNIYDLHKILHKKFDVIFMSYGVLLWLSDLKKWANLIHHFLKKGGMFYIVELHPFTNILSYNYKLSYDYFDKGPFLDNSAGSYTDWENDIAGQTYEWSHTLGDIATSLIGVGLNIEFIHEFPYTMYEQFPGITKKNKYGQYEIKGKKGRLPLLFSIKAYK